MRNFLLVLVFLASITACSKSGVQAPPMPSVPSVPSVFDSSKGVIRYTGSFKSGPYGTVTGKAEIFESNGTWQLRLSNFSTSSGPDLKVYLSKEKQPLTFIKLGALKSRAGSQTYEITGMPDFTLYPFILIHCEQFNHLFGSAELMKP